MCAKAGGDLAMKNMLIVVFATGIVAGAARAAVLDQSQEVLTAVISIKVSEPQFEGQTKTKLGNSEIKGIVDSIIYEQLTEFFEQNPPIRKKIIEKALLSSRSREAASPRGWS